MVFLFKVEESDDPYQIGALDLAAMDWEVYRHVARSQEAEVEQRVSPIPG
jgi:hypothetical protein